MLFRSPKDSPTSVPPVGSGSLYLHLDADSIDLANGAAVTSWIDLVNGYNFTGTATYDACYANGHASVYFDGKNNMLANRTLTAAPSTARLTLFVAGNFTTAGNDDVSDYMISTPWPEGTTANRLRLITYKTSGAYQFSVGAGSTVTLSQAADIQKHLFTIVSGQTGNAVNFMMDGAVLGTGTSGTGAVAMQALGLGGYHRGSSQFANCSIAEVLLYDRALTNADITIIYNYLAEKYISNNETPSFVVDPINNTDAIELTNYDGNPLAMYADDADGIDTVIFSKDFGPDWLIVAEDGTLYGTPDDSHVGENIFMVRITDDGGLYDTAQMTIWVANVYSGTNGLGDLLGLAAQWLMVDCIDSPACGGADLNGDNDVTFEDFSLMAGNWLGYPF